MGMLPVLMLSLACSDSDCPKDEETWYLDEDGDSYGSATERVTTCWQPEGTVSNAQDCDDGRPEVFPGAAEICADGAVNDCDDLDGEAAAAQCAGRGPFTLSAADGIFWGEVDGDLTGHMVAGAGDVDGDGRADLLVTAPGRDDGVAYLLAGPAAGMSSPALAMATIVGFEEAYWFRWLTAAQGGDLDGDGYDDLLFGNNDTMPDDLGMVWSVLGPVTGLYDLLSADARLTGDDEGDEAGASIAGEVDANEDGWRDLLVGSPRGDAPGVNSLLGSCSSSEEEELPGEVGMSVGFASLMLGPISGDMRLSDADARLVGEDGGDGAGRSVSSPGDLNGDGLDDLLIGAPGNCEGGISSGAAYVVLSPILGEHSLTDADQKWTGPSSGNNAGSKVTGAGDVLGDGSLDLLITALHGSSVGYSYRGRVYLVTEPGEGTMSLGAAHASYAGETTDAGAGSSIAGVEDIDADGYDDLMIGAPYDESAVYLIFGPVTGHHDLADADLKFIGDEDGAGRSVAGVGDVDADGTPDVLIGAPEAGPGSAVLLLGSGALLNGGYGP